MEKLLRMFAEASKRGIPYEVTWYPNLGYFNVTFDFYNVHLDIPERKGFMTTDGSDLGQAAMEVSLRLGVI
jgi:hypothetical protein